MKDQKISVLEKYMPAAAAEIIATWIDQYQCEFKIAKNRSTKLGDYRHPFRGSAHRISVNHNLNHFAFLVTTVHEFAHLTTWNKYQSKVKPHGIEWKTNFKELMLPFFELDIFPSEIKKVIITYLQNPTASSCSDINLFKALQKYDIRDSSLISVEEVPLNQHFAMHNGRVFKKLTKIRKRYRCVEIKTGLMYLFSPIANVKLVQL